MGFLELRRQCGVAKSWTRLSDFTFTFHFYALEKELATHSSVLAWRIPGTVEPGGLPTTWLPAMGLEGPSGRMKSPSAQSPQP